MFASEVAALLLPVVVKFSLTSDDATSKAYNPYFPLRNGQFFIAQGEDHALLNHHRGVSAQNYTLDITEISSTGFQSEWSFSKKLEDYHIYLEPVFAPCSGRVWLIEDGHSDRQIGRRNRSSPAGNVVALNCSDIIVVLGHLKAPQFVKQGDHVRVPDLIGKVGNSGNTTEPHLHIHAVRGSVLTLDQLLFHPTGVPITFGGRRLQKTMYFTLQNLNDNKSSLYKTFIIYFAPST